MNTDKSVRTPPYTLLRADRAAGQSNLTVGMPLFFGRDRYGCSSDDSRVTGIEHISVSIDESGLPFFTIPREDVQFTQRASPQESPVGESTKVKRYERDINVSDDGDKIVRAEFVLAADYDALQAELNKRSMQLVGSLTNVFTLQSQLAHLAQQRDGYREALSSAEMVFDSISDMKPGKFAVEACAEVAAKQRDEIRSLLALTPAQEAQT
jgi:hypothetical protein